MEKFKEEELELLNSHDEFDNRRKDAAIAVMKTVLYVFSDSKYLDVAFRILQKDISTQKKELTKLANKILRSNGKHF